eukprot:225833-Pleurochrysis_carterae.AAC.1
MPARVADVNSRPINAAIRDLAASPRDRSASPLIRSSRKNSKRLSISVSFGGESIGSAVQVDASFRGKLRRFLDQLLVEFAVVAIVLVYMVLILTDLMLRSSESGSSYSNIFKYIDLGFLMFFTLELCVRLYAYGTSFLFSFLNTFDALIVVISLILQIYWISDPSGLGAKPGFLSALRMVRLLRLFVVLNKVQNTRSAYKKTQILKAGPPVERVMQMLNELKDHAETDDMATDIEWIVSLIASDKLYSMDLHVAGKVDDEMRNYLKGMGIKKGESFMLPSSVIADADTTFDDYLDQQDNLFVREGGATVR